MGPKDIEQDVSSMSKNSLSENRIQEIAVCELSEGILLAIVGWKTET